MRNPFDNEEHIGCIAFFAALGVVGVVMVVIEILIRLF